MEGRGGVYHEGSFNESFADRNSMMIADRMYDDINQYN
jgi:hypothetical protein